MLLRVEVVNDPGRRKDPVFVALVVVAVVRVCLEHTLEHSAGEPGPLGGFGHFAVERIGRNAQPGHRDERVVLTVGVDAAGPRLEGFVKKAALQRELVAVARALLRGQVVVEQVVTDAEPIEQMSRSQVCIRFGEGVAPHGVTDGCIHVGNRRAEIARVAIDLVRKGRLGDAHGDLILGAAKLGRRRWRRCLESADVRGHADPLGAVRTVGAGAECIEFGGGEVDAWVHAGQRRLHGRRELRHEIDQRHASGFRARVAGAELLACILRVRRCHQKAGQQPAAKYGVKAHAGPS